MRIAFFGGSFDPPHLGHLAIARAARQALDLDQVLFAPVARQPLKPSGSSASFADRAAMTQLAIHGEPHFQLSLADAPQSGQSQAHPNYTIDTLAHLRREHPPQTQWFLLLGADSFRTLHHWHRADEIPFAATLIVASRPQQDLADLPALLPPNLTASQPTNLPAQSLPASTPVLHYRLENPTHRQADLYLLPDLNHDISATALRQAFHQHPFPPNLLPPAVLEYIRQHHLYAASAEPLTR